MAEEVDPTNLINSIKESFAETRNQQIDLLFFAISCPWTPIYVWGPPATGKTAILGQFFGPSSQLKIKHAMINCMECTSERMLYESILRSFRRWTASEKHNDKSTYQEEVDENSIKCDSPQSFIQQLELVLNEETTNKTSALLKDCFIILDRADNFGRSFGPAVLSLMHRLHELIELPIKCIFIGNCPSSDFYSSSPSCPIQPPIEIYFGAYTKEELVRILMLDAPSEYPEKLYENYIQLILSIFYVVTRNLNEIRHICEANFERYVEPIKKDGLTINDSARLWRNFEPQLKRFGEMNLSIKRLCSDQHTLGSKQVTTSDYMDSGHDLPLCAKYLLLAAYVASRNSFRSDRRFFVRDQGKTRKGQQGRSGKGFDEKKWIPKAFTFERMLQIYKAMIDQEMIHGQDLEADHNLFIHDLSTQLLSQVNTLISLKLLQRPTNVGSNCLIGSSTKLKISDSLSFDFVKHVAKSANFDLEAHLEAFLFKNVTQRC